MSTIHYRFQTKIDAEFAQTLKKRVNAYFKENNISKYANGAMILKTVAMFSMYLIPFVLLFTDLGASIWLFFLGWAIMGVGKAGIGTAVMHDALHGVYFQNKNLNKIMELSMRFVGADSNMWKLQHNVLHHTYTNIEHADEDIDAPSILRFSPHQKRKKIHRFQHIYAPVLYSLLTITWILYVDFISLVRYKKKGLIRTPQEFRKLLSSISLWKVAYLTVFIVLPILFMPQAWWICLLGFVTMHMITGFMLSIIFQPAHVMEANDFILSQERELERNWYVHQLRTTMNFAPKNKLLTWFIGGLNYQVEHHLFPNICHVHYTKISKIVKQTAEEFNMPYRSLGSFREAVWLHLKMLKRLGREDKVVFQPMA